MSEVIEYEKSAMLDEWQKERIAQLTEQIAFDKTDMILQYGSGVQKKIADFSEKAIETVKTKDLGEVGEMLGGLVTELQYLDEEEEKPKGIFGFFRKSEKKLDSLKARYEKAEVNVTRITECLEGHQIRLMKDVAILDQMYAINTDYLKELSVYIEAGKQKLEAERTTTLPAMKQKAAESGLQEDVQEAGDYAAKLDRFEKKVHDLELTRMVSMQMAPQIRMVQNNDTLMIEKIQSAIVNTIPLWKSQMVLAMGIEHSGQAAKASREVSDMTNQLLKKNAEKLKMATTATMQESERAIVDIETLKQTNGALLETIDEVIRIQEEGRQKRRQAEQELAVMEAQLKQKLLDASR